VKHYTSRGRAIGSGCDQQADGMCLHCVNVENVEYR
jgi:hypothetical protein